MWARPTPLILIGLLLGGCGMAQPGALDSVSSNPSAEFDQGMARLGDLQYDSAAISFAQAQSSYRLAGDTNKSAECMFWVGYCREKQGKTAEAADVYTRLLRSYGETPAAQTARARLAHLSPATAPAANPPAAATNPRPPR